MNIVAYGGGTDSTAMLIECVKRDIKIDLILFADTGGERPETYSYVKRFSKWLKDQGMPEIITVRKAGNCETLEENCLRKNSLPSIVYGYKTCSQKFKIQPQDKYCNNFQPCRDVWKRGEKVVKFIGYDSSEDARAKDYEDKKYIAKYPLIEWDIDRDECIKIIKSVGLCLPGKSACWFCPSSKHTEVRYLQHIHPDLAKRAVEMEKNAHLTAVKGLGRNWAWGDLLANDDMFPETYVDIACGCYDG